MFSPSRVTRCATSNGPALGSISRSLTRVEPGAFVTTFLSAPAVTFFCAGGADLLAEAPPTAGERALISRQRKNENLVIWDFATR